MQQSESDPVVLRALRPIHRYENTTVNEEKSVNFTYVIDEKRYHHFFAPSHVCFKPFIFVHPIRTPLLRFRFPRWITLTSTWVFTLLFSMLCCFLFPALYFASPFISCFFFFFPTSHLCSITHQVFYPMF